MKQGRVLVLAMALLGLVACATTPKENRDPANMAGQNYNVGTYECASNDGKLSGNFTFGDKAADLNLNGNPVSLSCGPANQADMNLRKAFAQTYKQIADICTGSYAKGDVAAGSSNSMGAVQLTVFLINNGAIKNQAILNCKGAAKKSNSDW